MTTKEIRLIVMDMDGTLLNSRQRVSFSNREALWDAYRQGIHLAFASGRLPGDIAEFMERYDLPPAAVLATNGTYCTPRFPDGKVTQATLAEPALYRALEVMRAHRFTFSSFAQNRIVIIEDGGAVPMETWGTHTRGHYAPTYLYGEASLARVCAGGVNKLMCCATSESELRQAREELSAIHEVEITSSWALNLEIMPKGANKGVAVRWLADLLWLDAAQVMAIGDYDNDASMIAWAGYGVAMANATQLVKQTAVYTTLTNDENGVAEAIRRYALR